MQCFRIQDSRTKDNKLYGFKPLIFGSQLQKQWEADMHTVFCGPLVI